MVNNYRPECSSCRQFPTRQKNTFRPNQFFVLNTRFVATTPFQEGVDANIRPDRKNIPPQPHHFCRNLQGHCSGCMKHSNTSIDYLITATRFAQEVLVRASHVHTCKDLYKCPMPYSLHEDVQVCCPMLSITHYLLVHCMRKDMCAYVKKV